MKKIFKARTGGAICSILYFMRQTVFVVRYRPDCIGIAFSPRYPYDDYRFNRRNRLPGTERF
ncbi:MAG: hypothetical protein ABIE07_08205 [Candidatus Zixiibacteriota bacterium]